MATAEAFLGRLRAAAALFQRGRNDEALALVQELQRRFPREPNLLNLAGLVYRAHGDLDAAAQNFRLSLEVAGPQPAILNSLANTLKAQGDLAGAEATYLEALEKDQSFHEAWKNLGLLQLQTDRPDAALASLERAIAIAPDDVRTLTASGNAYRALGKPEQAMDAYRCALAQDPNDLNALHNLGVACKMADRLDEAVACLKRAAALAPEVPEVDYNLGNAYFEQGRHQDAERCYLAALAKRPNYLEAHETLNELYWQTGRKDEFAGSYATAIAAVPDDPGLRVMQARALELAGRHDDALGAVTSARAQLGPDARLQIIAARIHANRGAHVAAESEFAAALALAPEDPAIGMDWASYLIYRADYARALHQLEKLGQSQPLDQLVWALRGLCWRLTGEPRHEWLNDYADMVGIFTLPVPPGYTHLTDFLADLRDALLAMHRTAEQPLEQTLVNGTQTPGRLLERPVRELQMLRAALAVPVREYIARMPTAPDHPLYGRRSHDFRFSGSWSVRLRPDGFHVNHVHPQGWISSSFYVHLPRSVEAAADSQATQGDGAIQFGESSLSLGERETVARRIVPNAGQLVLFPSYFWHGTCAFSGAADEYRLTAPFDAVPA